MVARSCSTSTRSAKKCACILGPGFFCCVCCGLADWMVDGCSLVLDVDTIREEVREHLGPDVLRLLETEAVPWQLADYRGGGVTWRTILSESGVCWRRYRSEERRVG